MYRIRLKPSPQVIRSFSTRCPRLARRNNQLDATGRTSGFARRASQRPAQPEPQPQPEEQKAKNSNEIVSDALQQTGKDNSNYLLSPVHIPEDRHAVLHSSHPSTNILANSSIVVQRQIEMMNVFMGFEQANRYVIMDPEGGHIGYLAEQEHGLGNAMARQAFRTHRSFTTHVFDRNEQEVLRFHRPFSWISSRIRVYDAVDPSGSAYSSSSALQGTSAASAMDQSAARTSSLPLSDMRIIGEAQQQWAPLRRKYNLFLQRDVSQEQANGEAPQLTSGQLPLSNSKALQVADASEQQAGFAQFAYVDEAFLSWDFSLLAEDGRLIGSVNRNFAGFAREIFTDTGVYALRMDAAGLAAEPDHMISQTARKAQVLGDNQTPSTGMTLDQRAVMLATAVSIDFDYFSRHSTAGHGGGFMPLWFPWWEGGGAAGTAEAGGAAGAAGAAGEAGAVGGAAGEAGAGAVGSAGRAAGGLGAGEGAVTGAGTMAGYEAMQRGMGRTPADEQSPQQTQDGEPIWGPTDPGTDSQSPQNQSGADDEWWDGWGGGKGGGGGAGGGGGGEGGGGGSGGGDGGSWLDLDDFF